MPRLTRRHVLLAGAGFVAAGGGWWGRYAFGDTFENHVARTLGVDGRVGAELVASLREHVDDYEARASAFLLATTSPSRDVMPRSAREEAIEAFIGPLMGMESGLVTPLAVAGRRHSGRYQPCRVLRA
jgi:hypothetical protein